MKKEVSGTLVDGVVQLDEAVDLPNNTRVQISLEPVADQPDSAPFDPAAARAAFESFRRRCTERPVHSDGERFSRDDLHERR
ncbi:MAG: hypothetical protein ACYTGL_07050 [Planctomycetota bacterium]